MHSLSAAVYNQQTKITTQETSLSFQTPVLTTAAFFCSRSFYFQLISTCFPTTGFLHSFRPRFFVPFSPPLIQPWDGRSHTVGKFSNTGRMMNPHPCAPMLFGCFFSTIQTSPPSASALQTSNNFGTRWRQPLVLLKTLNAPSTCPRNGFGHTDLPVCVGAKKIFSFTASSPRRFVSCKEKLPWLKVSFLTHAPYWHSPATNKSEHARMLTRHGTALSRRWQRFFLTVPF